MLTNSLFLDFLKENGLKFKNDFSRDVICVAFDFGSPSYEDEIKKYNARINKIEQDAGYDQEYKDKKIAVFNNLIERATENADKYCEISKQDLREKFYVEGITVPYRTYNNAGELVGEKFVHYKMLYRTPGKAKKGTCMFICDRLYKKAHDFLYMGIKLPKKNSPIVAMGAYCSLITSSIVGKVQIKPEQMLVINDVDSYMNADVVTINTDENKHCYAEKVSNYSVKNTMFDGQALIDSSIFPAWADGFILLRHHMTKCAAFNTNIELFMRDKFGDDYETATVKDMWGRDVRVKDIKLITTNNALKWLNFPVDFEYWSRWVEANDSMWGIVKTTHESKFGNVQRMSYQMVNALDINSMENVTKTSVEYIEKLKSDNSVFLDYLRSSSNFSNDCDVLVALAEHNSDFINSDYFRERKYEYIKAYVEDFKNGRPMQNADNLTIVGSPYAMLLAAVGEDPFTDPTFSVEDDAIQCYAEKFDDGEYLAAFRSPFNSKNNLGYLHNNKHILITKYFNLGKLCMAVNVNHTDIQDRENGCDFDSDSFYTTNQINIVHQAKYCYKNYPTIVNLIPKEKNIYSNSLQDFALVDNKLAAAQLAIGLSSNLAQLCLTYTYNFEDQKYQDYVCILSVLAQVAIDNAKRTFDIDLTKEIDLIKKDMDIETNGFPVFWRYTKKDKRKCKDEVEKRKRKSEVKSKIICNTNKDLVCPMNYLAKLNLTKFRNSSKIIPINDLFINHELKESRRKARRVEEMIEKYSLDIHNFYINHTDSGWDEDKEQLLLLRSDFEDLVNEIRKIGLSRNYIGLMSWLINRAFKISKQTHTNKLNSTLYRNRSLLMKVLYEVNPKCFLQCFLGKNCTSIKCKNLETLDNADN